MEVFNKLNSSGVYCSLLTGQEMEEVPFATHIACTIEKVATDVLYDVAIINEVQMLADPYRGSAWTRALLGLMTEEIHLCGDHSVLSVVKNICHDTGDDLHINWYERFEPLEVEAKTLLGDLRNVKSGDCVVAFSRCVLFEVKLAIEKLTNHKCCVIYGVLPPETRRHQASLFNDQDNEYDILIASDAIGMGLNLNIRRVVFYSVVKFNGHKMVPLEASQVKQIAGRAGRKGSVYPQGFVTTFTLSDIDYLIDCLTKPFQEVKKVGLFPSYEQFDLFAAQCPQMQFNELLDNFWKNALTDESYFFCKHNKVTKLAKKLEKVPGLTLEERFKLCSTPVNISDPMVMHYLVQFASDYSQKMPVRIPLEMPRGSADNDAELLELETKHQVLLLYQWLSHRFGKIYFPEINIAIAMADVLRIKIN